MARTLPWLKDGNLSSTKEARGSRSTKRQRREDSLESDRSDNDNTTTGVSRSRSNLRARARAGEEPFEETLPSTVLNAACLASGRTPSTSPPPAPPIPELMHEGYDRDDIYRMVEDEFQAVAQSFTQHLHHAEYQRLKRVARDHNASNIRTILRPVDSRSSVPIETQKKLARDAKETAQRNALEQMKSQLPRNVHSMESESEKEDDPWIGTSLHGLMASPRKTHNELTGVARITSHTRAAAGFKKAGNELVKSEKIFDIPSRRTPHNQGSDGHVSRNHYDDKTASEADDDDDLDAPISNLQKPKTALQLARTPPESFKTRRATASTSLFMNDFEDISSSSRIRSRDIRKRTLEKKNSEERSQKTASNLEDIPTFLI